MNEQITDEDQVIDRIRQDYVRHQLGFSMGLEQLLRSVYRAGYKQREIELMRQRLTALQTEVEELKSKQE